LSGEPRPAAHRPAGRFGATIAALLWSVLLIRLLLKLIFQKR
jgi:hypothetical protein